MVSKRLSTTGESVLEGDLVLDPENPKDHENRDSIYLYSQSLIIITYQGVYFQEVLPPLGQGFCPFRSFLLNI